MTQKQLEYLAEDELARLSGLHLKPGSKAAQRQTQIEWTHQDLRRDLRYLLEDVELSAAEPEAVPDTQRVPESTEAPEEVDTQPADAKTGNTLGTVPDTSSAQEKVAHYSEDQVKASDSAIDCYNRGRAKHNLGQYEAAIADYDNAIRLKPNYALAYNNRGLAKYYLGQYEAAIADYDNAIRLKPNYVFAYNNRGLTKHDLGQYEAAIADYDNAIRLKPNYALAYRNRKRAKAKLGQTWKAELGSDISEEEARRHEMFDDGIQIAREQGLDELKGVLKALEDSSDAPADLIDAIDEVISLMEFMQDAGIDGVNALLSQLQADRDNPDTEFTFDDERILYVLENAYDLITDETPDTTSETTSKGEATQETEPEPIDALDTSSVQEKVAHYSEDQVKDIVAHYFESLPIASPGYSVKREYLIQMGSDQRRADIVFLRNGKLVAIAECKRTRRIEKGNEQLHSYLCATDTFLGIFANHSDPNKWTFWENHRHNNFLEIDRETFENYVYNHDKAIKDREKKIKLEIEREIDAEIRQRVRKNTDTNAVRQNETDRIKREITENIDKTAIVNSVKSQIAQQAENRLLNKRDEENRKRGREQGFWWTIFSLIGIGILIALLITSAA